MTRKVDPEVIIGFVEEARGYLPAIRGGLQAWRTGGGKAEVLEEAFRHAHTIKGAAAMVGLVQVSHVAYLLEDALEMAATGKLAFSESAAEQLHRGVHLVQRLLEIAARGDSVDAALFDEAKVIFAPVLGENRAWPGESKPAQAGPNASNQPKASAEAAPTLASWQDEQPPAPQLEALAEFSFDPPAPPTVDEPPPAEMDLDEVSPELLEVFTQEAEEHLRLISKSLPLLEQQPVNQELLQEVRRSVHTLKGSAGIVGFHKLTQLAHRMEDLLDQLYEGAQPITAEVMQLLFASTDGLEDLAAGKSPVLTELYARYDNLIKPVAAVEPDRAAATSMEEVEIPAFPSPPATAEPAATPRRESQYVRAPIERLDEVVKLVSELVITRSTFEQRMEDFLRQVAELQQSSQRLRRVSYKVETQYEASALGSENPLQLPMGNGNGHSDGNGLPAGLVNRLAGLPGMPGNGPAKQTHGFDFLEFDRYTEFHLLSRELAETTTDIQTVGGEFGHLFGDFDSYLNRQARLTSEIEDKLMRLRMVPLATLASRLHRTVRNVAGQQGKKVELVLEGESTELDKTVLEEMADPLLHLLRNAVDHGIEPPELRQAKGKPSQGTIRLRAFHEGSQVVISVEDDGGGVDKALLQATAIERGFITAAEAASMSDDELRELIFLPGFSTALEISEISGRGVGLDVVKARVHKLKGTLVVQSQQGRGTRFVIRLPMTLAITRALLVKAHQETFAIPLDAVRQILRVDANELQKIGQEPVIRVGDTVYPVVFLGRTLNLKQPADESVKKPPVLILHTGTRMVALVVEHLIGGREIVVKNLGNHLRRVPGFTGATLMGDGSVVLILNPAELLTQSAPAKPAPAIRRTLPGAHPSDALTVMVVDDSPSVRRVVSNLLKNAGWRAIASKDGLEALELLHRSTVVPDLILLDIEMPRMDGYELLTSLRNQEAFRDIPVVMVTSRAGDKHRRKAMDLGATGYVIKPYQDEMLLETIRHLVRESRQAVRT